MKKIGLISSNKGLNGAAKMVETLTRGFAAAGHEVRLFHRDGSWLSKQEFPETVTMSPVEMGVRLLNKKEIRRVRNELIEWGATCLHSHGTSADRFNGCVRVDGQLTGVATAHARILHLHWRKHDAVIAPSNYTRQWYRKLHLVSEERFHIIPNALDVDAIIPTPQQGIAPLRQRLGLPTKAFLVLMIGSICTRKNQSAAVPMISELVKRGINAHLVVIGGADKKESRKLDQAMSNHGLHERVHLMGQRSEVGDFVGASDLVLSTSLDEQASVSLIETLAGARPAVSTNVGSAQEIIRNGETGWVFETSDLQPALDFMTKVATDPTFAETCSHAARRDFERDLTTPAFIASHLAAYEAARLRNGQGPSTGQD